jgi:hypothetical protein
VDIRIKNVKFIEKRLFGWYGRLAVEWKRKLKIGKANREGEGG